jgi:hypothetical protein
MDRRLLCTLTQFLAVVVIFAVPFVCWEQLMYEPFVRSIERDECNVTSLQILQRQGEWIAVLSLAVETEDGPLYAQHFRMFETEREAAEYVSSVEGSHTCYYAPGRTVSLAYSDIYFASYVPFVLYMLTLLLVAVIAISAVQFVRYASVREDVELREYENIP